VRWALAGTQATVTVIGDPDWGDAEIPVGSIGVSPVTDTGDWSNKTFTFLVNKYGTGSGNAILSIRGSDAPFGMFDASPAWVLYTAPTPQAWRYVQVRAEAVTS
jgi:hypothetical protein